MEEASQSSQSNQSGFYEVFCAHGVDGLVQIEEQENKQAMHYDIQVSIEVFENERYSPFSNFSSGSLLPTERGKYSTRDGTSSFHSLDEAQGYHLTFGWKFTNSWCLDTSKSYQDSDGWTYGSDFASLEMSGSRTKGMLHFVRQRRYIRTLVFDVDTINGGSTLTCDHCDLAEVDRLVPLLLEKFTRASIARHPRILTIQNVALLKKDFQERLKLQEFTEHYGTPYTFKAIAMVLEDFVNSCFSLGSFASSALATPAGELFNDRFALVSSNYLLHSEARELAKLLIRKNDTKFLFHCSMKSCGKRCEFAIEKCPCYNDCGQMYSKKWAEDHRATCTELPIECERHCGKFIKRKLMRFHLADECLQREIQCPYACIGCDSKGVKLLAVSLDDHLTGCQEMHLRLSLARLMEQQKVITRLHQKVADLEHKSSSQEQMILKLDSGVGSVHLEGKQSESRMEMTILDKMTKLEQRVQQRALMETGETNAQIKALQQAVQNMR